MSSAIVKAALVLAAMMAGAGCDRMVYSVKPQPVDNRKDTPSKGDSGYLKDMAVRSEKVEGTGAVEQALQWSERYSKVAEQLVRFQQQKQLDDEKLRASKVEVEKLRIEVAQARKELQDANAFLMEQKKQLANWKKNVTGLQSQNQQALLTIIRYQERIIELLDGELPKSGPPVAPAAATADKTEISRIKDTGGGITN